jgi:hypothetical protein
MTKKVKNKERKEWSKDCFPIEDNDHVREEFWLEFPELPLYEIGYVLENISLLTTFDHCYPAKAFQVGGAVVENWARLNFYSKRRS